MRRLVGHYPGIDGTLERTDPTAASAPATAVIKMNKLTKLKDKMSMTILREAIKQADRLTDRGRCWEMLSHLKKSIKLAHSFSRCTMGLTGGFSAKPLEYQIYVTNKAVLDRPPLSFI